VVKFKFGVIDPTPGSHTTNCGVLLRHYAKRINKPM